MYTWSLYLDSTVLFEEKFIFSTQFKILSFNSSSLLEVTFILVVAC